MPKSCRATVLVGEHIVTVGGTIWEGASPGNKVKRWLSKVFQLNTRTMEWATLPEYPFPVAYSFAAPIGTRIYVVGGSGPKRGYKEVFVLDLAAKDRRWIPGPSLPQARWGHAGAVVEGRIYIAGGYYNNLAQDDVGDVIALDPYRPNLGWQRVAKLPLPTTQWRMAAGCFGRLYLFGGLISARTQADKGLLPQAESFALDFVTHEWQKIRPLPRPMGSGAAAAVDSRFIALCGGYETAFPASRVFDHKARTYFTTECLLYDTLRGDYKPLTPMRVAVDDQGCVFHNGRLLVIGGEDTACETRTDLVQIGELL